MKRHLSNLAFVLSLVTGALVLLVWLRSHWVADQVEWVRHRGDDSWAVGHASFARSEAGGMRVDHQRSRGEGPLLFTGESFNPKLAWTVEPSASYPYALPNHTPTDFRMCGVAWGSKTRDVVRADDARTWRYNYSEHFLIVPYWFLLLPASILPAHRLVQTWRRRRRGGRGFEVSVR